MTLHDIHNLHSNRNKQLKNFSSDASHFSRSASSKFKVHPQSKTKECPVAVPRAATPRVSCRRAVRPRARYRCPCVRRALNRVPRRPFKSLAVRNRAYACTSRPCHPVPVLARVPVPVLHPAGRVWVVFFQAEGFWNDAGFVFRKKLKDRLTAHRFETCAESSSDLSFITVYGGMCWFLFSLQCCGPCC